MQNRNEILAQIVDSAEKDLQKMAMANPDDNKPQFPTENPDSVKKAPKETVKVSEGRAPSGILKRLENEHKINNVIDRPGSTTEPTAPIKKEKGIPFTKIASEEDVVTVLREESKMLAKEASVAGEEIDAELEKIAYDSLLELADLEKTADVFGERAAKSFLQALGIEV